MKIIISLWEFSIFMCYQLEFSSEKINEKNFPLFEILKNKEMKTKRNEDWYI